MSTKRKNQREKQVVKAFESVTERLLNNLIYSEQQGISSKRIHDEILSVNSNVAYPHTDEKTKVKRISKLLIKQHELASKGINDETRSMEMVETFIGLPTAIQREMVENFGRLLSDSAKKNRQSNLGDTDILDPNVEHGCTSVEELQVLTQLSIQSEPQELASTTIDGATHSEKFIMEQQQQKPSKRRQKKKSPPATMSTDQSQLHPEQEQGQQQQQRKPPKRRNKKKGLLDTSKDQCRTQPEQQESTTIIEEKDHFEEPPINFDQPTFELRVAEKIRGARLNCIEVTKISDDGIIEYDLIPTRSYWLRMVRDDWGATDDEIKASIASHQMHLFGIEVCGWHKGYGVILRDVMRNPIIVISKGVVDEYVSPFYHELQGVSLGVKLALKYKFFNFEFDCISEEVSGYVMHSWEWMEDCGCPPRDNPKNPGEKKNYCVKCSKSRLDQAGEGKNAEKILPLLDEIFYDALELEREGGGSPCFDLSTTELYRAQAVWHLANLGIDMELRLDEIDEDDELAEVLYKDVYGHGTVQELMFLHKFKKQQSDAKEQLYLDRTMAAMDAEKTGQFSKPWDMCGSDEQFW